MTAQPSLFESNTDGLPAAVIPGLWVVSDVITDAEERELLADIDREPWQSDMKRRVQHYGYRYDYRARRVDPELYLGELPAFSNVVTGRLMANHIIDQLPDQLIVNEYLPGQGISAHVDCEPCFADRIVIVSLGWAYEMDFIHTHTNEIQSIMLAPRSALLLAGESRYDWAHRIQTRKSDHGIPRKRRVSLTFRNVIIPNIN